MRHRSSKFLLPLLGAAALLAAGGLGEALGQTRQKQIETAPPAPQLQLKPARPSGGGTPTAPGGIKSKPPGALPDFILEPGLPGNLALGMPNTGFCKRKAAFGPADTVAMKVRFATNGTQAPANGWGASQVTVAFSNNAGTVAVPLPSPSWNGTVPLEVDIPNGCYKSTGCHFTIKVDPSNVVPETSNANNNTTKFCAAPAG